MNLEMNFSLFSNSRYICFTIIKFLSLLTSNSRMVLKSVVWGSDEYKTFPSILNIPLPKISLSSTQSLNIWRILLKIGKEEISCTVFSISSWPSEKISKCLNSKSTFWYPLTIKFLSTKDWKLCSQHNPDGIEIVVSCLLWLMTFAGICSFFLTLHLGQTIWISCKNLSFPLLSLSEVVITYSSLFLIINICVRIF